MYNVRFAQHTDLDQLIKINQQLGNYGWPIEQFHSHFAMDTPTWIVENQLQQVCGFLVATFSSGEAKILNLTINEDLRGQGLGELLLHHVLLEAKKHEIWFSMLEVRVDNIAALKLYDNLGFKILCIRNEYYPHLANPDAYLMQLDLRTYGVKSLASIQQHGKIYLEPQLLAS